jgi:hypothetical protein
MTAPCSSATDQKQPEDEVVLCVCSKVTYGQLRKKMRKSHYGNLQKLQEKTQVGKNCGRCLNQFMQLASEELPEDQASPKTKTPFVWTQFLRQLHLYSSLFACIFLLFFALTGWAMNHREGLGLNEVQYSEFKFDLQTTLLQMENEVLLVEEIRRLGARGELIEREREKGLLMLTFHSSGSHCEAEIDLHTGKTSISLEESVLLEALSEIHRSKSHDGTPSLFIDAIAFLMAFVALSGGTIFFAQRNLRNRLTWIILSLGFIVPYIIFLQLH